MRMKKAQFDRAAYVNQQPLNEQLQERSTIPIIYRTTWRTRRRRIRENKSACCREIQKSRA